MAPSNASRLTKAGLPEPDTRASRDWPYVLLIVLITLAAFAPAIQHEFVNWDDQLNFEHNPNVRGLSAANLRWMFTTFHLGPYQPLSWLSLAVESTLWSPGSAIHHLFNIVYHILAAVLLYFVAARILSAASGLPRDDSRCRIAATATSLIFAISPLRAESVAWASERRDVLSGFLLAATVLLYLRACDPPGRRGRLIAAIVVYALSLLAKAGGMTLPIVLLLLDFHPLRRFSGSRRGVLIEKAPFVALAVIAAALAWYGQHRLAAFKSLAEVSLPSRFLIASFGAWFYVAKTLLPVDLHPLYSLPAAAALHQPVFVVALAACILVTIVAVVQWRRRPWIATAWFSYLALLAPVSGLTQAGPQLVADRYSYLPGMVLAVVLGGLVAQFGRRFAAPGAPRPVWTIAVTSLGVALGLLAVLTSAQVRWWQNSLTLWQRVLAYEPANRFARANMAAALVRRGDLTGALAAYESAVQDFPDDPSMKLTLSSLLLQVGRTNEALAIARRAVELDGGSADARRTLGAALLACGQGDDAARELQQAIQLGPQHAGTQLMFADALIRSRHPIEAGAAIELAMRLEPGNPAVFEEASRLYACGLQLRGAIDAARYGLKLAPNSRSLQLRLAWLLATSMDDGLRDGNAALKIVEPLAAAPGGQDCRTMLTLGAALGEVGRFEDARKILAGVRRLCTDDPALLTKCRLVDMMFASHERFQDVEAPPIR